MVSKLKRDELVELINTTEGFHLTAHAADLIADRIIAGGWVPIEDFPDEEYPAPTQAEVNDVMERIISGLPARVLTPANPDGVHIYDVASLHPREFVSDYHRIPDFDNYEVNTAGEIRNRWTKRVLEVAEQGGEQYVEMHDKQGFNHDVNVRYVREKVFGA